MDLEGLSSVCAGFGTLLENEDDGERIGYSRSEFCLENLKILQRFLRRDNPATRDVFKQVCKWNTASKDLIPIIEYCQDDRELVIGAVKVLVFLTMPVESTSNDISQQIEYLWGLKDAVSRKVAIAVIVSLLERPLENLECEAFTEDDWKLVQLVLTLFRNVLAIQDIPVMQKALGSATQYLSLMERFLELLFHENVVDLVLVLTQHIGDRRGYLRQDNLLFLEIFHYIFVAQDPEHIVKASLKGSKDDNVKASLNSLRSIIEEEEDKRRLSKSRTSNLDRHSQFSGTFTKLCVDGSKSLCKGNPGNASSDKLIKSHKIQRGPVKKIVWDHGRLASSRENILELIYHFINQFLSGSYNGLMESVREDIEKELLAIQKSDVVVFFQVAQFIIAFQRHKFLILKQPKTENDIHEDFSNKFADETFFQGNICGPIAATMNMAMFSLVISKWHTAFDSLKQTNDYKSLSAAGSLMKNMISMLDLVLKLPLENSKEPQTARILLYKIFYDQTEQGLTQFLINLIKSFDTHRQSKSDLADLVEMIHVVVRLMETLQARGALRVSRKSKRGRKKKVVQKIKGIADERLGEDQNNLLDKVGEMSRDLSTMEPPKEPDSDGKDKTTSTSNQIEELGVSTEDMSNVGGDSKLSEKENSSYKPDDPESGTGDSSDDQGAAIEEVDFKVSSFVSALANNTIIQNLCWLLKFYKSNLLSTNHYIICTLRRICEDLELSPMLYQLSMLMTFYDILAEQKLSSCKKHENIVTFLADLVRTMMKKMKKQPLLFVEILFWKTRRECHCINSESLINELGDLKKESRTWGGGSFGVDGEMDSLQGKGRVRNIADSLGEDEADFTIPQDCKYEEEKDPHDAKRRRVMNGNEICDGETNRIFVSNSSRETEGVEDLNSDDSQNEEHPVQHNFEQVAKRRKRLVFCKELEAKIKSLYEKYKLDRHCNRLIAEDLGGGVSPAQVSRKLKQLALKAGQKKMMLHDDDPLASSVGVDRIQEGEALESETAFPGSNKPKETSILKRSLDQKVYSNGKGLQEGNSFLNSADDSQVHIKLTDELEEPIASKSAASRRKLKKICDSADDLPLQLVHNKLDDELEDSGDDLEPSTLRSVAPRRKRILLEDDD